MKTSDTLLLLIDSLTKAEKKSFSQTALNSDYYDLVKESIDRKSVV